MNTEKIIKPRSLKWVILALALLAFGFAFPQKGLAEYTLEPDAITGLFQWYAEPIETPSTFVNMGNKSLRIDTADRPRVVYGGDGLYYATWTGSAWDIKTVDTSPGVGHYASLALDSSNQAYIAYYDAVSKDLKYAKWSNTTNSWTISVLDGKTIENEEEEEVGGWASIDLDSSNNPHIVYFDDTHDDLLYIRWSGSKWEAPQKIDSDGVVGLFISMYIDGDNDVHVSYYDFTNKSLKYAVRHSGSWTVSTVDNPNDKVGTYSSIDVDFLGFPHISYYNETKDELKYARWNGTSWVIDVVASDSGKYSSIETDGNADPHISYFSDDSNNLRHATKPGNSWQEEDVQADGDVGYYTSLAVDDDNDIHITYYRMDTGELRHAELNNDNWTLGTIATDGNLGLYTSIATGTNGQNYVS
ncbi:MAG TPA: hypothetical protein PK530_20915, partial [Anaerolineales bacterium]|nr:hypothetical protein [Anaerolineales bacterium]